MASLSSLQESSRFDETVYVGLGSNVGDREQHLRNAQMMLQSEHCIQFEKCSTVLETAPWGGVDQPRFLNCAVKITTSFSPLQLLEFLKSSETQLGRVVTQRWGPRVIDMDILLFGQRVLETEQLTIPHRELSNRLFVLRPLLELHRNLIHPRCGTPLRQILKRLDK